ncbi:hypothetical protein TNCV_4124281 [Trichonephila clavipes]|nr:hypothetical protein TNCV_4124281 [Trichonephila clavipes]
METNLIWQSLIDHLHIISAACISMAPEVHQNFCHTHPPVLFAICETPHYRLTYLVNSFRRFLPSLLAIFSQHLSPFALKSTGSTSCLLRAKEWHRFLEDFNSVISICIGRCVVHPQATRVELHSFADASKKCYAAVIYCRSQSPDDATTVKLVTSKGRLAPVKSVTMPRL